MLMMLAGAGPRTCQEDGLMLMILMLAGGLATHLQRTLLMVTAWRDPSCYEILLLCAFSASNEFFGEYVHQNEAGHGNKRGHEQSFLT